MGYRWSRANVIIAAASVFLLEMKFSFDKRGNINSDLSVVCFLNPYLGKKEMELLMWETSKLNIQEKTLAPLHI